MQKKIIRRVEDTAIPEYVRDILTGGIAKCFLRMNIEGFDGSYTLSYDTGYYKPVNVQALGYIDKLKLIQTLMAINEEAEGHLLPGDSYMLKRNLIYSCGSGTNKSRVRIMYVPDAERVPFHIKLASSVREIGSECQSEEADVFRRLVAALEDEGLESTMRYLDKSILRACRSSGNVV